MQDILGFTKWLTAKVKAEFPDLNVITVMRPHATWQQSNTALADYLKVNFGDKALEAILQILDRDYNLSVANTETPISFQGQKYFTSQINLDFCRVYPSEDFVENFKAVSLHEMAHIVGAHKGYHLGSLREEAMADLFQASVMVWLGFDDHPQRILEGRIKGIVDPTKLSLVRSYNYPTIAVDAEIEFFDKMRAMRGQDISFSELYDDIEGFLFDRQRQLDSWFGFDDGMSALRYETTDLKDILGVAAQANHPQVGMISNVMGVEPNLEYELQHEPNPFISRQNALLYAQARPPYEEGTKQKEGKTLEDVLADSPLSPEFYIMANGQVVNQAPGFKFSGNMPR